MKVNLIHPSGAVFPFETDHADRIMRIDGTGWKWETPPVESTTDGLRDDSANQDQDRAAVKQGANRDGAKASKRRRSIHEGDAKG